MIGAVTGIVGLVALEFAVLAICDFAGRDD